MKEEDYLYPIGDIPTKHWEGYRGGLITIDSTDSEAYIEKIEGDKVIFTKEVGAIESPMNGWFFAK